MKKIVYAVTFLTFNGYYVILALIYFMGIINLSRFITVPLRLFTSALMLYFIIKNLKNGMIKNLEIKDNDFEQSKLYFNQCLEYIESNKTKLFTQDAYQKEMNDFMKKLEQKYDNNQR